MSDNIPFEIQMEIIKCLPVKPLIRFRSVSKLWKSFIDSSEFIKVYGARHTQPHNCILIYKVDYVSDEVKCFRLVDEDIRIINVQQELAPFAMHPLLKRYHVSDFVGVCQGLVCFYGYSKDSYKKMLVIWNLSIGKSFGIALRYDPLDRIEIYGFGVCPHTRDPTVVKILCADNMPWHVEVFTLSSGVFNVIPCSNLPHQSIELDSSTHVVIDRFIYWGACEKTLANDGEITRNHMVVSFNLITNEFKAVDLPDSLTNKFVLYVSVSKLKGSLVVSGYIQAEEALSCGVWVMERDSSFRKLFSIGASVYNILGFRKNGEPILEFLKADEQFTTLNAYDPCSEQIKNLEYPGYSGSPGSFVMGSYKESLLLLDHSDIHIYCDDT